MNPEVTSRVASAVFALDDEAYKNNWRETAQLLDGYRNAGFDFNYKNSGEYHCNIDGNGVITLKGYSLLHRAIGIRHLGLIRVLFKYGVNFSDLTDDGYSPIMIAVCCMQRGVVSCLMDCNADVEGKCRRPVIRNIMPKYDCNIADIPQMITPLMSAIENGDSKMIKILLEGRAKVNAETIRHCLRVGQVETASMLLNSLHDDISFEEDEISGVPSLQFYINNYSWTCNDSLMDLITEYKARGYSVCKSNAFSPPVFQSFVRHSIGSKTTVGFDFIKEMDDVNVNETYLGQPPLSSFFSRDSLTGHHSCCSNKTPCCRYYLQWFVRECADFQLYTVKNFVYHQGHLDVLYLLYEAGAIFPTDFRSSAVICSQSCTVHRSYDAELKKRRENQLDIFCKMIEKNPVKSLFSLARIAVRKIPNIREKVKSDMFNTSVGSVYLDFITFRDECDTMGQKSFDNPFFCCSIENDGALSD